MSDFGLAGALGWQVDLDMVRAMDELTRALLSGWLTGRAQARKDRRAAGG